MPGPVIATSLYLHDISMPMRLELLYHFSEEKPEFYKDFPMKWRILWVIRRASFCSLTFVVVVILIFFFERERMREKERERES